MMRLAVAVPVVCTGLEPPAGVLVPGAMPFTSMLMSTSERAWYSIPANNSMLCLSLMLVL